MPTPKVEPAGAAASVGISEALPCPRSVTRAQVGAALSFLGLDPNRSGFIELDPERGVIRAELFDVGARFPRGLMDAGVLRPVVVVEFDIESAGNWYGYPISEQEINEVIVDRINWIRAH